MMPMQLSMLVANRGLTQTGLIRKQLAQAATAPRQTYAQQAHDGAHSRFAANTDISQPEAPPSDGAVKPPPHDSASAGDAPQAGAEGAETGGAAAEEAQGPDTATDAAAGPEKQADPFGLETLMEPEPAPPPPAPAPREQQPPAPDPQPDDAPTTPDGIWVGQARNVGCEHRAMNNGWVLGNLRRCCLMLVSV